MRELRDHALERWLPVWLDAFADHRRGGFYERLDSEMQPLPMGYKRLLTQCRQLFVYSQGYAYTGDARYYTALSRGMHFLQQAYHVPHTGGWRFSVTDDGAPHDDTYDLYGQAFVILALSFVVRATHSNQAHHFVETTLEFLAHHAHRAAGFAEQLDSALQPRAVVRRQNSHMHLFEACLFAYEITGIPSAATLAGEIFALFMEHFFDNTRGNLVEFFSDRWQPHPTFGHIVEPGHHYEWIWLLDKYATLGLVPRSMILAPMQRLYAWAQTHGRDPAYGGIFNRVNRYDGAVLDDNKRIWHVTEALKAHAVMQRYATPAATDSPQPTAELLRTYVSANGAWVETKNRTMQAASQFLPGTTPYHLLMGVCEAGA